MQANAITIKSVLIDSLLSGTYTVIWIARMAKKFDPDKRKSGTELVRKILSEPEYRGRHVRVSELIRALKKSKSWFYESVGTAALAQEWLSVNQDAPLDVKVKYEAMLKDSLNELQPDTKVKAGGKEFYVTKEEAQQKAVKISGAFRNKHAKASIKGEIVQEIKKTAVVPADKNAATIERIRNQYVLATLGDLPNVGKIMKDFGLIDQQGRPTTELTEDMVRQVMLEENWKQLREDHLHRTFDVLPDEIKFVTLMRNVETQRMLYDEIKTLHRNNMQYYGTGQVKSLDGQKVLDYEPDPGVVAGLAEIMRRMVDGGGNINVLIQNNYGGGGAGRNSNASIMTNQFIAHLNKLSPDELKEEISRMEALATALSGKQEKITLEDIESQATVIDVTPEKPSTEK